MVPISKPWVKMKRNSTGMAKIISEKKSKLIKAVVKNVVENVAMTVVKKTRKPNNYGKTSRRRRRYPHLQRS